MMQSLALATFLATPLAIESSAYLRWRCTFFFASCSSSSRVGSGS
jgi:predicted MFS family arabinose efflux permease